MKRTLFRMKDDNWLNKVVSVAGSRIAGLGKPVDLELWLSVDHSVCSQQDADIYWLDTTHAGRTFRECGDYISKSFAAQSFQASLPDYTTSIDILLAYFGPISLLSVPSQFCGQFPGSKSPSMHHGSKPSIKRSMKRHGQPNFCIVVPRLLIPCPLSRSCCNFETMTIASSSSSSSRCFFVYQSRPRLQLWSKQCAND